MKTINLTTPRAWAELTDKQLVYVSSLFLEGLTKEVFLLKAFMFLTGLKVLPRREGKRENPEYTFVVNGEKPFAMTLGKILDFSRNCNFLLKEQDSFSPLPKMAGREARDLMMYDACFEEFITAMVYYNKCRENTMFIHKLCAVMYPFKPWDPDNIHHEDFMSLPLAECYTAVMWFGFVLNKVSEECPNLFKEKTEDTGPVNLRDNIHAMFNLVTSGDITKEKEIRCMEAWRVLYDMDDKVKGIQEMNEKLEQYGRV